MPTTIFNIIIRARGARVVRRNINEIGISARRSRGAISGLSRALGGLGAALGVRRVVQFASQFQNLQNRVRLFSNSQEGANKQINELISIANRARQGLDDVGIVYQRLAINQDKLGISGKRLNGVIETIAKSVAIGGSNAQEARGALRQFGQALSGDFQRSAQELNSVIEQTPGLADALIKGLIEIGVVAAGSTTADLKRLTQEGILNTASALRALEARADDVDIAFSKIAPTFSQTAQKIANSLTVLSGRFFEVTGLGEKITEVLNKASEGMLALANDTERFNEIIQITVDIFKVFLGLGVAKLVLNMGRAFTVVGGSVSRLVKIRVAAFFAGMVVQIKLATAAMRIFNLTNPLGLVITAITLTTTLLAVFKDNLITVNGEQVKLRDIMVAAWTLIKKSITGGKEAFDKFIDLFTQTRTIAFFNNLIAESLIFGEVFSRTIKDTIREGEGVVRFVGALPQAFHDAMAGNLRVASANLGQIVTDFFVSNVKIEDEIEKIAKRIRGKDFIGDAIKGAAGAVGRVVSGTALGDESIIARDARLKREAEEAANKNKTDIRTPPEDTGFGGFSKKVIADREKALNKLLKKTDEVAEFNIKLAEAVKVVDEAFQAGIIKTQTEADQVMRNVVTTLRESLLQGFFDLQDELDPVNALLREQADAIKDLNIAFSFGAVTQEQYNLQFQVLEENTRKAIQDTTEFQETLSGTDALLQGSARSFEDFTESLGTEFSIIATGIEGAFNQGLDAITEFAKTGEFNLRSFTSAAVSLIQQVIIKLLVLKAIQLLTNTSGIGGGVAAGGVGGASGGAASAAVIAGHGAHAQPGQDFIVGDRGPELFTAPRAGTIVPNDALSGGGGRPQITIVNVTDPNEIPAVMGSQEGQEVILNVIQRNRTAVRTITSR